MLFSGWLAMMAAISSFLMVEWRAAWSFAADSSIRFAPIRQSLCSISRFARTVRVSGFPNPIPIKYTCGIRTSLLLLADLSFVDQFCDLRRMVGDQNIHTCAED